MNGAKQSAAECSAGRRRSDQARAILTRHFGYPQSAVESYFNRAARLERRKVAEIENAVIRLACDLF